MGIDWPMMLFSCPWGDNGGMKTINSFLSDYFWVILLVLVMIFFLAVAAGATWGLPAVWHADEQLHTVMPALINGLETVPQNVFYPTLPFFTMFVAGKIFSQVTEDISHMMAGIRIISALLGALTILLTALMTLTAGRPRPSALVAATLVFSSSGFATIAHHAMVDIYLSFFVILASFLLLRYVANQKDIWLYLGFLVIGLAASSKYNGASLLLAATMFPFLFGTAIWRSGLLYPLSRLILAYGLAFLGFALGTPRAILNAPSHLEQLMSFLQRQRVYAGPDRPLGIVGQWDKMLDGLGPFLSLLFILGTLWAIFQAALYVSSVIKKREPREGSLDGRYSLALLLILLAFELPLALSQFYPMRYMVPAYPILAVLSAFMLADLWRILADTGNKVGQQILVGATIVVIFFSALRFISVIVIFANDSRTIASNTLAEMIPPGSRIEHTLYPPHLPTENRVVDNYPLKVFKFEEDIVTHSGWNTGEEGIEFRKPDYLVVDRKTYERFEDSYVCSLNPVECRFFDRLLHEETNYELVQRFEYHVPPYLPAVKTDFANIELLLFRRREEAANQILESPWEIPTNAQFGQNIFLQGYDRAQTADHQLNLTLYWTTRSRLAENYKVFIHCLDASSQIISQSDAIPAEGMAPSEYWLRNEIIKDMHILDLPESFSSADCLLQVGLYQPESGERLPLFVGGQRVKNDALPLNSDQ